MKTPWLLALILAVTAPALAGEDAPPAEATSAAATPIAATPVAVAPVAELPATETICNDHVDNDGDAVYDCGDTDCSKETYCQADGKPETGKERCGDWIDNDGDGLIDCEDQECQLGNIPNCKGSWKGDFDGEGGSATGDDAPGGEVEGGDVPATGDKKRAYRGDVEQPDSEDGVGFIGIRFGVVAAVQQLLTTTNLKEPGTYDSRIDTRFDTLQLRAFGSLPLLEDSFFLLSLAASQSPRISFAMFQFPLGKGHYFNINTGGGTLSAQPLVSAAKRPLLDNPIYLRNPFDQFLDAGVEVNGPIVLNLLRYRVFAGGGSGLFGNFGGRSFEDATVNPTFSTGAQLQITPIGIYNRFDSPFLYRPVPLAASFSLGGKYEQRERERFPAAHGMAVLRYGIFAAQFESYNKAELNFGALQTANYLQVGVLLWPEWFFLAADIGHFYTSDLGQLTTLTKIPVAGDLADVPNAIRRQRNEIQARAALHWYFWRQNGVMTLRYTFDQADPVPLGPQRDRTFPVITHEAVLQAQVRF
jgi:hypothetical protein